jgi:ribosomal protein S6
MRHYEIVFLVHPDQSEQVPAMIDPTVPLLKATAAKSTVWKTGVVVNWLTSSRTFTKPTTS